VAENRNLTGDKVREIAKAESGRAFKPNKSGLVDEIGGLSKALEIAKELAGIPGMKA